jgi:hypothetical protein
MLAAGGVLFLKASRAAGRNGPIQEVIPGPKPGPALPSKAIGEALKARDLSPVYR